MHAERGAQNLEALKCFLSYSGNRVALAIGDGELIQRRAINVAYVGVRRKECT